MTPGVMGSSALLGFRAHFLLASFRGGTRCSDAQKQRVQLRKTFRDQTAHVESEPYEL